MADKKSGSTEVDFNRLNWLGKAIYVTGHVARAAGSVVETVVDSAAAIITDAERAFLQGLDSRVEDAKILEEYEEPRK